LNHDALSRNFDNQLQPLRAIYTNDLRPKLQLQKERPKGTRAQQEEKELHCMSVHDMKSLDSREVSLG
jgi:hypothetical protein